MSMTAEAVSDTRIREELWVSFVSVIRSYVAAHDISREVGRAMVDDGADGRLTLRGEVKTLTIEFDATTGDGKWRIYEDDPGPERELTEGTFRIRTDSTVEFSDRIDRLELEIAAESFTARVFED